MMRICVALLLVGLIGLVAAAQTPQTGPAPMDIKGWHGAEWGMGVEQATAAANLGPFSQKPQEPSFPTTTAYVAGQIAVGTMTATVTFYFEAGLGLGSIGLNFGDAMTFGQLRDELK